MPALTVCGQRLGFLAGDDLRGVARITICLRTGQLAVLIPSIILLSMAKQNLDKQEPFMSPTCVVNQMRNQTIVWTFWGLSATTILTSIVLECYIFRVSSRGSPVQMEQREKLPCLCAIKLIPLSVLRVASVLFALYTLVLIKELCRPSASKLDDCFPNNHDQEAAAMHICPTFTVEAVSILAYTHLVEMITAGILVLFVVCRGAHSQHNKFRQWLLMTKWMAGRRRRNITDIAQSANRPRSGSCWHCFCRFCCACTSCCTCCMFGGTEVVWTSRRQTSSLSDISIALADYFDTGSAGALDVTPSDLLVGMNILAYEQRIQKQERFAQLQADLEQSLVSRDRRRTAADGAEVDQVVSLHSNSEVDVEEGIEPVVSIRSVATGTFEGDDSGNEGSARENSDTGKGRRRQLVIDPNDDWNLQLRRTKSNSRAYFKVATRRRLKKENEFDRRVILEGAHYLRLAHAVYGHMMYLLQHPCSAPCCLAVAFFACHGSCNSCKSNDGNGAVVVGDNLCRCNELGFLHVAGLDREDLAYVSFKTGIRTCPYGIVVDREKKTVVLVIRGTFSLESTVTDLNIRPELLEDYGDKCEAFNECLVKGEYCHSGILHCALFVYKDLERHKILDKLLLGDSPRFPGFTLIVTGHSLGAGVGAVLSLMLRNRFHALQCLCFSPPGCVMSEGISSHDFMTSYILDSDIVPRLSLHSVVSLRNDVLKMIARIKVPKHVAFSQERLKRRANGDLDLVYRRESIPESAFYRRLCDFQEHQEKLQKERDNRDIKLVIPGTLIHIVKHITHVKSGFFDTRQTVIYTPVWAARDDFAEIQLTKSLVSDHDPEKLLLSLTSLTDFFPLNQ